MLIAIDPGKNGGIAYAGKSGIIRAVKMPDTDGDILALLTTINSLHNIEPNRDGDPRPPLRCHIEKVGGFIKGNKTPGSAMFNFGHGRGVIVGIMLTLGWSFIEVPPIRWQKWLGIGTIGGDKNKLKAEAQRRFPNQKVTLCNADALLMLDHAASIEKRTLQY